MTLNPKTNLPDPGRGRYFTVQHPEEWERLYGRIWVNKEKLELTLWQEFNPVTRIKTLPRRWFWPFDRKVAVTEQPSPVRLKTVPVYGRHPIAVQNAAYRALKLFRVDEERSALVGKYPPKKLDI